jgi:dihydroflavonol-4-reductase
MLTQGSRVFVTGGNGFIGSRVVAELISRGYRVRCLLRKQSDVSRIQHLAYEAHEGDILKIETLTAGMSGCDGVIHLAGISSWEKIRTAGVHLHEVIVQGTKNVLDACSSNESPRLVYVSSSTTINAGDTPKIFTEKSRFSPKRPQLHYSQAKRDAERLIRRYRTTGKADAIIVNPCEVYGPMDIEGVTASNLQSFLRDFPAVVCRGGTAVAHVEDVSRGIVSALEKGRLGERYILGGENLTLEEIARNVRKIAGLSDRVVCLPSALLRAAFSSDILEYASLYWFMDSSKAKEELGYHFRPAIEVFSEVVPELLQKRKLPFELSLRYGGGTFDVRTFMLKAASALQKRDVMVLNSDPVLCGQVLNASNKKGDFIESLIATPAWHPVYSVESTDGETWKKLSEGFKKTMNSLEWRIRLPKITLRHCNALAVAIKNQPDRIIDAEEISRLVLRVLYELLFSEEINIKDEELFYLASLEWRKEIAVKGAAQSEIKAAFMQRLQSIVSASRFKEDALTYGTETNLWLSIFAQPFLISPQINLSDIFCSVFHFLRKEPKLHTGVRIWAKEGERKRMEGVILEAIRLKHPFPILERELTEDLSTPQASYKKGTQFFILLDQFQQDIHFDPDRWLKSSHENPYASIPFGAGPRMCIGKPIAMELLTELLIQFLTQFPEESIQPKIGHLYSGRDNDHRGSISESLYQGKVFARVLWRSFRIGREKASTDPSPGFTD